MPPDNAAYYHAAYIATAIILGAYTASILWRTSRARRQLKTFEDRDKQRSAL